MVTLAAGQAEVRLVTVKQDQPAGDPMVDFIVLTTEPGDTYQGFQPYGVGSPFCLEALAATRLYLRFQNTAAAPAQLRITRAGHFQPNYGGADMTMPEAPVAPGQWSQWVNIGPFCRLVHDEGLWLSLPGARDVKVQVARDAAGNDLVGDTTVPNGEAIVIPIDITWNRDRKVLASRDHAAEIVRLCKGAWRTANGGRKPKQLLYYGAFPGGSSWVADLKDALGYNTGLPDRYEHAPVDGLYAHASNEGEIRAFAATIPDRTKFKVLSFGDEISIGAINFDDPAMQPKFVEWLKAKGIAPRDAEQARLADRTRSPRIAWYASLFSSEQRFDDYRRMTALARELIGPQVETGANYSPHGMPQYYGSLEQWVDIFKHNGMTMFWTEDYIFSVPHPPQIISWMFATMRCAVKYNGQVIHMYVMPHAPGQTAETLRRNMVFSIGSGARHIDSFWVAPAENFTENYISWGCVDSFRAVHESIFDSAEAEPYQVGGKARPARVAIVLSRATDHNEREVKFNAADDPFLRRCDNAPAGVQQTLCRADQQMLYLALRHAQHGVDLVTEDDILDGCLKNYDVVYFAGEWVDERAVPALEAWVRGGGILYAAAGLGRMNQYGGPCEAMMALLGLKACTMQKNVYVMRPYLELPLVEPIGTITLDGQKVAAVGMRQELTPADARVIGTWENGRPSVTVRELGKGKAFAVGTLPGQTYMKTGVRAVPWARGGRRMVYNPSGFAPSATKLALLGVEAKPLAREAVCSNGLVEAVLMDSAAGTLVTLTNWDNQPIRDLTVTVRLPRAPASVRSVQQQRQLPGWTFENGAVTFTTDLEWADYFLLSNR